MRELVDPERIDAEVGEPFAVVLSGNGVGGYLWQLPELPDGIRLLREESLAPAEPAPGAAGTRRFELEASAAGELTLRFERRRPWEGEPDRVSEIRVRVRRGGPDAVGPSA